MQFFDYNNDLSVFESLTKDIEDPVDLFESEDDVHYMFESTKGTKGQSQRIAKKNEKNAKAFRMPSKDAESLNESSDELDNGEASNEDAKQIRGSVIANAIKTILDVGETDKRTVAKKRNELFRAAYFDNKEQFSLGQADQYEITNDSSMTDSYFKVVDDTHIVVNFSLLVRMCTTKAFDRTIQSLGKSWKKATATTLESPFSKAIEKALKQLANIVDSGAYGVEDENNPINKKKKEKEEKEKQKEQEPPTEEPTQEGEPKKDEPPTEEEPNVEVPEEDDPKKLYSTIMKDFRENYQQNLEADCDARKDDIDDAGREELTEDCYHQLMEPYMDKADEEVQDKIHKIVAFYVKKYTNDPNAQNAKEPDGDDMNWSEPKKTDGSGNEEPNESKLEKFGNHIGNWVQAHDKMMNDPTSDKLYGHSEKTSSMVDAWKDFGSALGKDVSRLKKVFGKDDKTKHTKNTQKNTPKKAKKHEMDWS